MNARRSLLPLASSFVIVTFCLSQDSGRPCDEELERVVAIAGAGEFSRAIVLADSMLRGCPDFAPGWWTLGHLFTEIEKPESAAICWEKYRRLAPDDWRVLPGLIQAYQSQMDSVRRDERRALLLRMFEDGKDTSLASRTEYLRDAFRVDTSSVEVYEQFRPTGDRQVFIYFYWFDSAGKQIANFSLGSYERDNQFARELGRIKAGERIYHLDFNAPKSHATYGMYYRSPSYDGLRAIVIGAIRGTISPYSTSTFK